MSCKLRRWKLLLVHLELQRGGETQLIFSHMDIPSYKTALLVSQYYNLDLLHLVVLDG